MADESIHFWKIFRSEINYELDFLNSLTFCVKLIESFIWLFISWDFIVFIVENDLKRKHDKKFTQLQKHRQFKMKILFLSFGVIISAENLRPRDFAIYDEKLRSYQNITGIDERTFNQIWEAGISNRKHIISVTVSH